MKKTLESVLRVLRLSRPAARDPLIRWRVVEGTRIRFLDTGPSAGPVLLMVHGWGASSEDFRPIFGLLPPGCRAIALDLPGCGRSDKPIAAYDVPYFVGFLNSFCDALGLASFVLLGHSMGGQIVVHFTTRWPDPVRKLVLVAPYGLVKEAEGMRWASHLGRLVDVALRFNNRLFIRLTLRRSIFYRPTARMMRLAEKSGSGILGRVGARATSSIMRNMLSHGYVEKVLPRVRQDTLLIWGDKDKVLPIRNAQKFMALLPSARLATIADSGHTPMAEKPVETARLISEFIVS